MPASLPFTSTTFLHFLSIIISAVVTGLATVNFGILHIWINTSAGALTLVYHITILVLTWRRKIPRPTLRKKLLLPEKYSPFYSDVKLPITPSPVYAPPPYETLVPNRRPISHLPEKSKKPKITIGSDIPSGPFYSLLSLFLMTILEIITVVGLGMTVEVTFGGAKSLQPAEREKGMTFPWNIKVQKAQCTFLGVLAALGLIVIIFCVKGRLAIARVEEEKREQVLYGLASPERTEHEDSSDWDNYHV